MKNCILVDSKGNCLGDLCRLDLEFANSVHKIREKWNPDYHMSNGFDRFGVCSTNNAPSKNNSYNGMKQGQCCGKGLYRHTYNPSKLECCKDGSTKHIGAC